MEQQGSVEDNTILQPQKHGLRDPSTLFYQAVTIRRSILASYWLVILLALPLWWSTTSIQRLSLPSNDIGKQSGRNLRFPVSLAFRNTPPQDAKHIRQSLREIISKSPNIWTGLEIEEGEGNENASKTYVVKSVEGPSVVDGRQLSTRIRKDSAEDTASTLAKLLASFSPSPEQEHRIAQFSTRYRLAFTLLNEDASSGPSATSWDVSESINRYIVPTINGLEKLHNFTIESQVQYHAPLAFRPRVLDDESTGLTAEDLTVFVNSAQWTLSSSVSNDPVLHFLLFVPSATHRPLHILSNDGSPTESNAFLLPQWGGIVILDPPGTALDHFHLTSDDLRPHFSTFSRQLLTLLGVQHLPSDVQRSPDEHDILTQWQLDALLRRRAIENTRDTQDTLNSIIKLVNQIENMPVGHDVKGDVQNAITALQQVYSSGSLAEAFDKSATAFNLASRAFFNPGMLALLYFPAEHKYAVYTPLFASAIIPLAVAGLREFSAWRKTRKATT